MIPAEPARAQFKPVRFSGKVSGMGKNQIVVQMKNGKTAIVSVDPTRPVKGPDGVFYQGITPLSIEVRGEGTIKTLRTGLFVRFEGLVEGTRRKIVKGPVSKLTVFTPDENSVFGLLPNKPGGAAPGGPPAGAPRGPGGGVIRPGGDLGRGAGPAPGAGGGAAGAGSGEFLISGKIAAFRGTTLTVAFPGGSIQAKIAPDAVVKLVANSHLFAQRGDAIEVEGLTAKPPHVLATKVKITRGDGKAKPKAPADAGPDAEPPKVEDPGPDGVTKGKIIKIN